MTRRTHALLLVGLLTLMVAPTAKADRIRIGRFSDQATARRAVIGARIDIARSRTGERQRVTSRPVSTHVSLGATERTRSSRPVPYPTIAATAPILRNSKPVGPQSFWYSDGNGHVCMYAPSSVLPCFTVVAPGNAGAGGLSPSGIAASVARRLPLLPGEIRASPSQSGLTGAESWFWLDPAPQQRELSVSLGGETVTVVAVPEIEWRFGDGATLAGGAGVSYSADAAPAGSIRHVYQTRCLAGDQGHDPYVLAACAADGYRVEALVTWRISYQGAGPIAAAGALPARTTTSSTVYPVSEARAFLVGGGAP